jgi:hypothetical protein
MPEIDFIPFATGSGANVEGQTAYAADSATATGFVSGVASSQKCNKAWRQSTFVAAAVANFIAEVLDINVLDDGNLSEFVTNLRNAIAADAPVLSFEGRTGVITLTAGDVDEALGYTPLETAVLTFNTRSGAVTLTSSDVTTALSFTPANKAGDTFTGNVGVNGTLPIAQNGHPTPRVEGLTGSPTANSGRITYGTSGPPGTLAEGEIYIQHA